MSGILMTRPILFGIVKLRYLVVWTMPGVELRTLWYSLIYTHQPQIPIHCVALPAFVHYILVHLCCFVLFLVVVFSILYMLFSFQCCFPCINFKRSQYRLCKERLWKSHDAKQWVYILHWMVSSMVNPCNRKQTDQGILKADRSKQWRYCFSFKYLWSECSFDSP